MNTIYESIVNVNHPTNLSKVFYTYDMVVGNNPIYITRDENYRFLMDLGVIAEKDGVIEDTNIIPAFASNENRFIAFKDIILKTQWCADMLDKIGDDGVSVSPAPVMQSYSEQQVLSMLWWMDNLNIITIIDGKYVMVDEDESESESESESENEEETKKEESILVSNIDLKEDKYSIFEYLRKIEKNSVNLSPDFQRSLVWSTRQKSKFIESAILDIPLPPIYLKRDDDNSLVMVDGLQRTACLREFFGGKFALEGIEMLKNLQGLDVNNLKEKYPQYLTRLEDKQLQTYIISPSVRMEIVYDIFERINTGGTKLERQEIRNCIYTGKATRLLKEIAESPIFRASIDNGIMPTRMKDREAILRCLTFVFRDYETEYTGSMDEFLNGMMKMLNKKSDAEIAEIKEKALRVYGIAFDLYGRHAFRIPTYYTRGRISIAVMETFFYVLWNMSDDEYARHKEQLQDMGYAIFDDEDYVVAVRYSTNNKYRVDTRFTIIKRMIDNILDE